MVQKPIGYCSFIPRKTEK